MCESIIIRREVIMPKINLGQSQSSVVWAEKDAESPICIIEYFPSEYKYLMMLRMLMLCSALFS